MHRFFFLFLLAQGPLIAHGEERDLLITGIQCRGNSQTSCKFIQRLLPFTIGNIVDSSKIKNAEYVFSTLPYISGCNIYLEKAGDRGQVTVVVQIEEASPYQYETVFNNSVQNSDVQYDIGFRLRRDNILGYGKSVSLSTGAYKVPLDVYETDGEYVRFRYIDPNLFQSRNHFFSAYAQYLESDLFAEEGDRRSFERWSANITLGQRLWDFSYLTVGYVSLFEGNVAIEDNNGDGQYRAFIGATPTAMTDTQASSSVKGQNFAYISFGWNTEDNPYFARTGSKFNVTWSSTDIFTRKYSFYFKYNWPSKWGGTWSAIADKPNSNGIIAETNPADFSRYRAILREQYSVAYSSPFFFRGSDAGRVRWQLDAGVVEGIGEDSLESSIGVGISVNNDHFGLVSFNLRYISDE